ncbi:MAG: acyl-CoA thioesterase [Candidatus Rokuibacteriota bacterium]
MPTIAETTVEKVQWVFPEHAGAPGQIHGGRMMEWITHAGTLAAARVARGQVVLGAMDDIDFLHPVRVGEIAILRAQVEYVGRSSLEVGVRVWAENVATGRRSITLNSHLVFVSVDEDARPRRMAESITPADAAEAALVAAARHRRDQRLARFARREPVARGRSGETELPRTSNSPPTAQAEHAAPATTAPVTTAPAPTTIRWRSESVRPVLPEDALFGNMMFAGKLLMALDEAGGILCMRYCRGLVMTACLDAMDFHSPIYTHEVVTFTAGLNHVGTSSLEVGVEVLAEKPWAGEVRHACTAFLTFVHLGPDLRPRPCPPFTPETPEERRRWDAALVRREQRLERVKRLKAAIANERLAERE